MKNSGLISVLPASFFTAAYLSVRLVHHSIINSTNSVRPEMVGFGSDQGRSTFETAGVVLLRRGF
jgi:hypothetical protein